VQCKHSYREASVDVYSAQIQNLSNSAEILLIFGVKSDGREMCSVPVSGVIGKENNGGCL
jgi:hypothetical protein